MTQQQKEFQAFLDGHAHGHIRGTAETPRQAQERFPKWSAGQIDAYLNGQEDGIAGDYWRVRRIRNALVTA